MTVITVDLADRRYDIVVEAGLLQRAGEFMQPFARGRRLLVVTDEQVASHVWPQFTAGLGALETGRFVLPSGEGAKSWSELERLTDWLLQNHIERSDHIVALGGGVVGDITGFAAHIVKRGCSFIQIPTTLLAQVDSSVGGKVGINLPLAKNLVGAFWQPAGVLIDLAALDTLPAREYRSGLAEVVKYGAILDEKFFEFLEGHTDDINSRDSATLLHLVRRSCGLKAQVVSADEHEETGQRAVLNYGHTFCHAIETVLGYGKFLHGEAVAIGMIRASRLAELVGRIDGELTARQEKLLADLGLPTAVTGLDIEALLTAMQRDKKVEQGRLRFVLPSRLGHVELVGGIDVALVRRAWQF